jgi:hypothetical protein
VLKFQILSNKAQDYKKSLGGSLFNLIQPRLLLWLKGLVSLQD